MNPFLEYANILLERVYKSSHASLFCSKIFRETPVKGFDPSQIVTKQVFYPSKDGTLIPMFIYHAKVS